MSTFNYKNVPIDLIGNFELTLLNNKERNGGGSWLINTFFPNTLVTDEKQLAIASLNMTIPPAPFVSPCVEGVPVRANGSVSTDFIKFAYINIKMALEPCTAINASILNKLRNGNMTISQGMSTAQAIQIDQIQKSDLMKQMVDKKLQLMAAELFTTGKLTIISDNHPLYEADFGRDPAATFVPAIPWSSPASIPVDDIETMSNLSFDLAGNYGQVLVMRTKVWKALARHQNFNDVFIKPYSGIRNVLEGTTFNNTDSQANFKIKLDNGMEVWTYDGFYTDSTNTRRFYLPDNYCGLVSSTEGTRAFGVVEDIDANYRGYENYINTWKQPNPAILYLGLQSAPMLVPGHANMVIGGNGFVV